MCLPAFSDVYFSPRQSFMIDNHFLRIGFLLVGIWEVNQITSELRGALWQSLLETQIVKKKKNINGNVQICLVFDQ